MKDLKRNIVESLINRKQLQYEGFAKKAFTVSEVLVAAGILGVVAAITIPVITTNYQKMAQTTKFRKSVTEFSNIADNFISEKHKINLKQTNIFTDAGVNEFMTSHFKVTKACGKNNTEGCFATTEYRSIDGTDKRTFRCDGYSYLLADSSAVCVYPAQNTVNPYLSVYVDINGPAKPNMGGRDMFAFYINEKGESVFPVVEHEESEEAEKTSFNLNRNILTPGLEFLDELSSNFVQPAYATCSPGWGPCPSSTDPDSCGCYIGTSSTPTPVVSTCKLSAASCRPYTFNSLKCECNIDDCVSGYHLSDNLSECIPNTVATPTPDCPSNKKLDNNHCVCASYEPYVTGATISNCALYSFSESKDEDRCLDVQARNGCRACSSGYALSGGKCTKITCGTCEELNASGTGCVSTLEVEELGKNVQNCKAYSKPSINQVSCTTYYSYRCTACEPGYVLQNNKCEPSVDSTTSQTTPNTTCEPPKELWKGSCVDPCPSGKTRNQITGICVRTGFDPDSVAPSTITKQDQKDCTGRAFGEGCYKLMIYDNWKMKY